MPCPGTRDVLRSPMMLALAGRRRPAGAPVHEGVARAASVAGDGPLREHHLGLAKAALADQADDEDRTAIAQQLDDVPPVRQRPTTAPDGGASPAEVR